MTDTFQQDLPIEPIVPSSTPDFPNADLSKMSKKKSINHWWNYFWFFFCYFNYCCFCYII